MIVLPSQQTALGRAARLLGCRSAPFVAGLLGGFPGVALAQAAPPAQAEVRQVITPAAYDRWKATVGLPRLSDDGRWVVYTRTDNQERSELVVRATGGSTEYRIPGGAAFSGGFTADSRFFVYALAPVEDSAMTRTPRRALGILTLATGQVTTLPGVTEFVLRPSRPAVVAYRLPQDSTARGDAPAAAPLVIRTVSTGKEYRVDDVATYAIDPHGAWLIYAIASPDSGRNGVYRRPLTDSSGDRATALVTGPGRYTGFIFDPAGTRVAFVAESFATHRGAAGTSTREAIYLAPMGGRAGARRVVSAADLGDTLRLAGGVRFTWAGNALLFSVAPAPTRSLRAPLGEASASVDSSVAGPVVELWHYRDPYLHAGWNRAGRTAPARTAIYWPDTKQWVQLGTEAIPNVTLNDDARVGLAVTSAPYALESTWGLGRYDVYLVDTRTGRHTPYRQATWGPVEDRRPDKQDGPDHRLVLSPTGKYLLHFERGRWWSRDLATGRVVDLTGPLHPVRFDSETHDQPAPAPPYPVVGWTPGDGRVLLYDAFDIWALDPSGASRGRNLTGGLGRRRNLVFRLPPWYANAPSAADPIDPARPLLLAAEDLETGKTGFWQVRLDGTVPPRELIMTAARLMLMAKAADAERYVLTRESFQEFPDLWTTDRLDAPTYTRLTRLHPQQRSYRWGTAELVHFTNAAGQRLRAVLHKPEDFDSTKQYPLLVYIYERQGHSLHDYYAPEPTRAVISPVVYTSKGYLVLRPDIAYQVGKPCASAVGSVVPAVQALIARGIVDPKRIGLQGHSWGAYETVCLVTRTRLFRAASAGNGVVNMTSGYGNMSPDGESRAALYEARQSRMGTTPWESPEAYVENSSIFHVQRIQTPLLVMANDADPIVPWEQGLELFTAMRRLGKEMYLFNYSGEGHALERLPNRLDWERRMEEFFDHFLMDGPRPRWMTEIPGLRVGGEVAGVAGVSGVADAGH